jgi:hypothetical protein
MVMLLVLVGSLVPAAGEGEHITDREQAFGLKEILHSRRLVSNLRDPPPNPQKIACANAKKIIAADKKWKQSMTFYNGKCDVNGLAYACATSCVKHPGPCEGTCRYYAKLPLDNQFGISVNYCDRMVGGTLCTVTGSVYSTKYDKTVKAKQMGVVCVPPSCLLSGEVAPADFAATFKKEWCKDNGFGQDSEDADCPIQGEVKITCDENALSITTAVTLVSCTIGIIPVLFALRFMCYFFLDANYFRSCKKKKTPKKKGYRSRNI